MKKQPPAVTVIIAAPPHQEILPCLRSLWKLRYPVGRWEILVTRGRTPSHQRNLAVREAAGELIYFLDDDALVLPANLERGIGWFEDPGVVILGGPSLCPNDGSYLQRVFGAVMASGLALGPSAARYAKKGPSRAATEKELILCNLLVRKSAFLAAGGFDERLYPNEENAFMDRVSRKGGRLIYDPEFAVYRYPRDSLAGFTRMLFRYGRGRAEQCRLHPTRGSLINTLPALWVGYLAAACAAGLWARGMGNPYWMLPAGLYLVAMGISTVFWWFRWGMALGLAVPWVALWSHLAYGLGFWAGLLGRPNLRRAAVASHKVTLERIDPARRASSEV